MTKIRQVLRCHAAGKGSKSISRMLGMSRTTIRKYIHIYQTCGKSYEEILSMDDSALYVLFQEKEKPAKKDGPVSARRAELEQLLPGYEKCLKKPGWTKEMLYKEYCAASKDAYGRSRFMAIFRSYIILSHPVAHIEHKAGDKMYVDYAGDKPHCLVDKDSGEIVSPEVFAYIRKNEHLPKNQLQMLTFDPSSLLLEAANLHPDLELYLERVIEEKKYPEQAFKSCRGVMSLVSKVGLERLLKACRLASASGLYNYLAVADILKNKQDELPEEEWGPQDEDMRTTPEHENVRGKEYYK